jgi:YD repeat-containing protein
VSCHTALTRTDVTGTTTVTLDPFGRETAMTTPVSATAFTFAYRADGLRKSQDDPSGAATTLAYDKVGRLVAKDVADAACTGSVCVELDHTYKDWVPIDVGFGARRADGSFLSNLEYIASTTRRLARSRSGSRHPGGTVTATVRRRSPGPGWSSRRAPT